MRWLSSAPNPLHSNLLRLFENSAKVRLVTTNFDLHFTSAAESFFSSNVRPDIYSAPALPLGGDFYGIAYLHGSVERPERLVLTDADFGRAYLTEGWARRFLQQLFASYVVMFVGYSFTDPVVPYLARGLPPESAGKRRFALTKEGDSDRWCEDRVSFLTPCYGTKLFTAFGPRRHSAILKLWPSGCPY
jgi:hypothetical protein